MKTIFLFSAPWCQHCQTMEPLIETLQRKGIPIEKVNVDYEAERAKSAKVQNIPTLVLAQNGQEIKRFVGVKSLEQIIQWYNS